MNTLGVISSKGGVGKTVVSINLSAALMKAGRNVVLVDSDVKMSGVGLQLGMYSFHKTINDILAGKGGNILEAMCIHSSGLRIIPASLCLKEANMANMVKVLKHPSLKNSKIVVDTPPGMEKNAFSVMRAVDDVVVVTTPEIPAIADAIKSIKSARECGCNVLGVVVNRYNKNRYSNVRLREIEAVCDVPVLGAVPEDKNIQKSLHKKIPVTIMKPKAPSSKSFHEIAGRICEIEKFNVNRGGGK